VLEEAGVAAVGLAATAAVPSFFAFSLPVLFGFYKFFQLGGGSIPTLN
jgi:hypothetical protein